MKNIIIGNTSTLLTSLMNSVASWSISATNRIFLHTHIVIKKNKPDNDQHNIYPVLYPVISSSDLLASVDY